MKNDAMKCIEENKVIVIVRKLHAKYLIPATDAMYRGGIRMIEITFDPSGEFSEKETLAQIAALRERYHDLHVGAGTVLTPRQAEIACEAGADFIISPNTDPKVIEACGKLGVVSIPGAMTPTEIQYAYTAGADYVKIFPASNLGPEYFRAVLAPLNHIKVLAVGGIDDSNMDAFLSAGAIGVGVGSCIVRKDAIVDGDYNEITLSAKNMTERLRARPNSRNKGIWE